MKAYWDSLTKEQQGELAGKVGSTPGYLRLVFNGYKKASFVLAKKLEQCTSGAITKSDLRPDSDALIIEGCLARLKQKRPEEHSLLVAHYLYGISKRKLAKARKKDEKIIRIEIQMAEGFIEGCLAILNVSLDMD